MFFAPAANNSAEATIVKGDPVHLPYPDSLTVPTNDNSDTADYPASEHFASTFFAPASTPLRYTFGAVSHPGNVRPANEDHFAVLRRGRSCDLVSTNLPMEAGKLFDESVHAAVVADGMGGERFGELASRLALEAMFELAEKATSWIMKFTSFEAQQIRQRVQAYVDEIQNTLQEYIRADPALAGMGTTWTSALCLGRDVLVVHIGDSRAYTLRQQELRQITHDETLAQALVDAGKSEQEVKQFRHLLLNNFGGDKEQVRAQIHHVRLDIDDRLLLASDGLSDMVPDERISEILQQNASPQKAADELVDAALAAGGKDNVTVIVAAVG